jgi:putative endonuclease
VYYVYVLRSEKDGEFYTGYSNDLRRRLTEHCAGRNFSTRYRLSVKLMYYEVCGNLRDAQAREKYLKSGMGKRYIKNRLKYQLSSF